MQFRHLCRALGGFIGSQIKRNQYRKTNRIGGTKSTRKKTQAGEEGRRVCCESFEEKPRRRRSIPRRPFCLSSISPLTARLPRNFNLLVLAAPRGKLAAHIQVEWNLSGSKYGGYLDCVPNSVENFERTAMTLPGFVRKGTLSRIFLQTGFSLAHAETLANAVIALKAAEESAL